jgi:hypothetical protein
MFADPPPAVATPAASDDTQMIEVVAQRPDQAEKIDRRIYRVRENAQAAVADGYQLMRGLPAVTIGPDDQLMLLGNANVTILVDEHPIQGDPAQFLRTIHGSDIERIEIITNPSAQFPSVGTGGIINIVLKRKRRDGLTGSLNAEVSSLGRLLGGVTLKYKKDKWTLDATVEGNSGRWSRSTYRKLRSAVEAPGGTPTSDLEQGGNDFFSRYGGVSADLTYDLDDRTQLSGGVFAGGYSSRNQRHARFEGLTPDFPSFAESGFDRYSGSYAGVEASFNRKGKTEGETLKGYALFYRPTTNVVTEEAVDPDGGFTSRQERSGTRGYAQLDWTHPVGEKRILSVGGQYQRSADVRHYLFEAEGGPIIIPGTANRFDPVTDYLALYATYQQSFGSWTVMPGLRVERLTRDLSAPGGAAVRTARTNLFPTFHLDHPLSKSLTLSFSYSKRIDRADVESLRPYPIVTGLQSVTVGNPALKDQSTDAFEASLRFHRNKLDAGLILYDRETSRFWGTAYALNDVGMNVGTMFNIGQHKDRGAQLDVSTPLFRRVKTNASINLFDSRSPVDFGQGASSFETFRYSGNATLEWDGPQHGARPGDILQIQGTYDSANRLFETRYAARYRLSVTYTHSLGKSFAVTASLENFGQPRFRYWLEAPLVREYSVRRETQPLFRLKLVKTFGGSRAPAPPQGGGPPIPPGG